MTPVRRRYRKRNGTTSSDKRHELPNDAWLGEVTQMLREGKSYAIYVKGYSMRPFIEHTRDRVFLEKRGDRLTLQVDGNVKGVELCREQDVSGVVTQYIRPNRIIAADDPKLVRRIRLWRKLRPIRRFLLFIYNAIR